MKKVGIVTLYPSYNYGGILQCIALFKVIKEMGYEPIVIKKIQKVSKIKGALRSVVATIPFHNFRGIPKSVLDTKRHASDIKRHIKTTHELKDSESLDEIVKKYNLDSIVVGSDQVWRMDYVKNDFRYYFLETKLSNIKKVSYAASFGIGEWSSSVLTKEVKRLIQDFYSVSVREQSGVGILKEHLSCDNPFLVLDPTLLIETSYYKELSSNKESFICTYFLDEKTWKKDLSGFVCDEFKRDDVRLHHIYGFNENKNITYSIYDWLGYFLSSRFIITDSYHGMVFAIIFNKQFLVLNNVNRGSDRFYSLLSLLGLENRLIENFDNSEVKAIVKNEIDYGVVNRLLKELKADSKLYLKGSLL